MSVSEVCLLGQSPLRCDPISVCQQVVESHVGGSLSRIAGYFSRSWRVFYTAYQARQNARAIEAMGHALAKDIGWPAARKDDRCK